MTQKYQENRQPTTKPKVQRKALNVSTGSGDTMVETDKHDTTLHKTTTQQQGTKQSAEKN